MTVNKRPKRRADKKGLPPPRGRALQLIRDHVKRHGVKRFELERYVYLGRGERTAESVDRIRFDLVEMAKAIARTKAEIAAINAAAARACSR